MPWTNTTGKTIYLNADRSAVVPDDAPEVAWVLVGDGGTLPDDVAARYGLAAADPSGDAGDAVDPAAPAPTETPARRVRGGG